ncbi:hypothetical protein DY000_02027223 [Brassica cretica]|uniref:Uncharacterized protein n=1 Tax=Brassica cretica TaxID=69181 RepID=A0ABQ7ED70_BRACR|nr:hypothetical protein DY000_02027223 [Brassica cretica]
MKRCLSRWVLSANENGVPLSVPLLDQGKQRDLPGGGSWRGSKSVTVDAQTNRKVFRSGVSAKKVETF